MPLPVCVYYRCTAMQRWDTTRDVLQRKGSAPLWLCHAPRHRLQGVFGELVLVDLELLLYLDVQTDSVRPYYCRSHTAVYVQAPIYRCVCS